MLCQFPWFETRGFAALLTVRAPPAIHPEPPQSQACGRGNNLTVLASEKRKSFP